MIEPRAIVGRIEVFGLSGAGKSTTFEQVGKITQNRAAGASRLFVGPRDVPSWRALAATARLVIGACLRRPASLVPFLIRRRNWWLSLKLGYRAAGISGAGEMSGGVWLNSGVLQPFVQFEIEHNKDAASVPFDALVARLPLPAAAIYVRVSPDIAMARWRRRDHQGSDGSEDAGSLYRFRRGEARCERLSAFLAEKAIPIHVHDNSGEIDPSALERLAEFILVNVGTSTLDPANERVECRD